MKNSCALYAKFKLSYKVIGREKLRDLNDGGYVVASNHVSFLDPPLVGIAFPENIYYFARRTLFDHPVASWMLHRMWAIPVDQERPEMSTLKKIIQLLKDGEKVVIFPEGERTYDGVLKDKGQAGVGMIVDKSKAKVLVVRLFGPEKALPRNAKKVKKVPVTMVVGDVLDLSDLTDNKELGRREKYDAITSRIMEAIRAIELPDGDQAKE